MFRLQFVDQESTNKDFTSCGFQKVKVWQGAEAPYSRVLSRKCVHISCNLLIAGARKLPAFFPLLLCYATSTFPLTSFLTRAKSRRDERVVEVGGWGH